MTISQYMKIHIACIKISCIIKKLIGGGDMVVVMMVMMVVVAVVAVAVVMMTKLAKVSRNHNSCKD